MLMRYGSFLLRPLSQEQYHELLDSSRVLERDGHGVKVLMTEGGKFVKFFRRKRLLTSAWLNPYASRFVNNARALRALGILTVDVEDVAYCRTVRRTLVFYRPVPGVTLRTHLRDAGGAPELWQAFARFLAELHDKGVYFRSIHLNNVIVSGGNPTFGLIDVADMKISARSLSWAMRVRNFKHLTRYAVDRAALEAYGIDRFVENYSQVCAVPEKRKELLREAVQQMISVQ